jgi:hypothetical protein
MNLKLLNWNMRGINNPAKRQAILLFISSLDYNFVCLQETKVVVVTRALVIETLGPRFGDNFIFFPLTEPEVTSSLLAPTISQSLMNLWQLGISL